MRLLNGHGMSLKKARAVVERLATRKPVAVELRTSAAPLSLVQFFSQQAIDAALFGAHDVDVKGIREAQNLSQADFALLYGLDENTLKNWEQGRNQPDGPARVLLNVIAKHPEAVLATLTQAANES